MKTRQKKTKRAPWTKMAGGLKPNGPGVKKSKRKFYNVSKSRAKQLAEYRRLRGFYLSIVPTCECAGMRRASGHCICQASIHPAIEIHHCKGRSGKLLMKIPYWIAVCRKAHQWIHKHPAAARRLGLILPNWNSSEK